MIPRWAWRFDGAAADASPVFTTRFDAEQWLGRNWRRIGSGGVEVAILLHNGTPVPPPVRIDGAPGSGGDSRAGR